MFMHALSPWSVRRCPLAGGRDNTKQTDSPSQFHTCYHRVSHLLPSNHQDLLQYEQLEKSKGESLRRSGFEKTLLRLKKNITHANENCQSDSLPVLICFGGLYLFLHASPHGLYSDDPERGAGTVLNRQSAHRNFTCCHRTSKLHYERTELVRKTRRRKNKKRTKRKVRSHVAQ